MTALAIDRGARHRLRQAGSDPSVADHVATLLALRHAATDDVVDALSDRFRPCDQTLQRRPEDRSDAIRQAPTLADGCPHGP